MSQSTTLKPKEQHPRERTLGGIALILAGALILLANATQSEVLGLLFLPLLGLGLLAWGFYVHEYGFAVPGCILTGLGAGTFLAVKVLPVSDTGTAGVIVLGLAAGFVAIALLSPYFDRRMLSWPLIPAGVLGVIGVMLLIGGAMLNVLELANYIWPVVLIAVGLGLLFWPRRSAN